MPKRDEFAHDNNDQDSEDDSNDRDSKDDEELMLSGSSSSDDSDGEEDKSDEAMETEKFSPNHSIVHSHSHYPSNSMYLPRQLAAGQYRPDGESDVERDQEVILGIFHACSLSAFCPLLALSTVSLAQQRGSRATGHATAQEDLRTDAAIVKSLADSVLRPTFDPKRILQVPPSTEDRFVQGGMRLAARDFEQCCVFAHAIAFPEGESALAETCLVLFTLPP